LRCTDVFFVPLHLPDPDSRFSVAERSRIPANVGSAKQISLTHHSPNTSYRDQDATMAAAPTTSGGIAVSEYDLMLKLAQHLDRHMIFPLLEFSAGQVVDEESGDIKDETKAREITQAKYGLLKKTNMTDYVANLYCELEGLEEPPAEFADKKQKVFGQLQKYEQETSKIIELLERDDVVNNLRSDKVANLEFLKREHEVGLL
jgi:translation initiation factor 3 subunit E